MKGYASSISWPVPGPCAAGQESASCSVLVATADSKPSSSSPRLIRSASAEMRDDG